MRSRVGVNTKFFNPDQVQSHGLDCVEVCLGRDRDMAASREKVKRDLQWAHAQQWPVSVHLPVFLPPAYAYDYLDAFFLDNDPFKREMSFAILEENLRRLSGYAVTHYVLHFPGVYRQRYVAEVVFRQRLIQALGRLDDLARRYGAKIMLEYFGSNIHFCDPAEWTALISEYPNLGILIDTGHLAFAARMHDFKFEAALEKLLPEVGAFHLWTVYGPGYYKDNLYYRRYHHIIPTFSNTLVQGWAFELAPVLDMMKSTGHPIIVEASPGFVGYLAFVKAIKAIQAY